MHINILLSILHEVYHPLTTTGPFRDIDTLLRNNVILPQVENELRSLASKAETVHLDLITVVYMFNFDSSDLACVA